mmetsp:Transcript_5092/g.8359  ORF Transcript_5092/g.8359 Transcript_5092/m.8359 type:complete len:122 (-) Transcript_5092:76-441(-)
MPVVREDVNHYGIYNGTSFDTHLAMSTGIAYCLTLLYEFLKPRFSRLLGRVNTPVSYLTLPHCLDCCPVCLEALNEGDSVGQLPCGHVFHADCIQRWLWTRNLSGSACPMRCTIEQPERGI